MILHITNWRSRGGGTAVARTLFDAEAPRSVLLCFEDDAPADVATRVAEREYICRPADFSASLALAADLIRSGEPLLVHSHGRRPGFHARAMKLRHRGKVRVVHSFHGLASFSGVKKWLSAISESALSMGADAVVADGPAELTLFRRLPLFCPRRLVMPAFTPANVIRVTPGPLRRIGMAARMGPPKLHQQLIETVAHYNAQARTPLQLVFVGDGPDAESIASLGHTRLGDAFQYAGHVTSMASFHASIDLFALLTRFEGMPLALLDAMACGLPCLATDVIGCNDLIAHERNGMLVAVGDIPTGSRILARLVADDGLRARLGEAARLSVLQRNSPERFIASYHELFRALEKAL